MKIASMTSWFPLQRGSNSLPMGAASRWRQAAVGLCSLVLAGGLFAQAPTIDSVTQPDPQVAVVGATVTLNATAMVTGGTPVYQWFKNGLALAGESGANLVLNPVAAGNAGVYSCRVQTNPAGPEQFTNNAELVVVSPVIATAENARTLNEDGNLLLSISPPAAPARPALTYTWKLDGNVVTNQAAVAPSRRSIRGATTRALAIAKVLTTDAGTYTCEITGYGNTVTAGTFELIVTPRPIVAAITAPAPWRVGDIIPNIDVDISNPAVVPPVGTVKFKASRLPAGVTINETTGVISGRPLRATTDPVSFSVIATSETTGLKSLPVTVAYSVLPAPVGLPGVYYGLAQGDRGSIRVTVTQTGAFSGTLIKGASVNTFRGLLDTSATGAVEYTTSLSGLTLTFTSDVDGNKVNATYATTNFEGYRQIKPATALAGRYNLALTGDTGSGLPYGDSFASLNVVANSGTVRYIGRMSDGTVVTLGSGICAPYGEAPLPSALVPVYHPLYAGNGSLQLLVAIQTDGTLEISNALWNRPAIAGPLYPAGFSTTLTGSGRKYEAPVGIILGLTEGAGNAELLLESPDALETPITQSLTIAAPATASINGTLSAQLNSLVINRLDAATGLFFGTATIADTVGEVTTLRKTKFYGILPGTGPATGHFLLNASNTNILYSGLVEIRAPIN